MGEVFKQEYRMPDGRDITSLVMDRDDFDGFIDRVCEAMGAQAHADTLKKAAHLPLMGRGTKTERFFKEFDVKTDLLSAIVRGTGMEVLMRVAERDNPERN